MNPRRSSWLAIAILVMVAGCSLTPDRIALNSLQTVKASAESSLRVAADLYNANAIREDQWKDVVTLYAQVQAACKTAAAGLALVKTDAQAAVIAADAQRLLVQLQALVASFQKPGGP